MEHHAIIVTDLGFGDAGKGSITDALVRRHRAGLVVRYNGGAQAAHTVQTTTGERHTFHQFGSGTMVPGTATLLSKYMLANPLCLVDEEMALQRIGITDGYPRLFVDGSALVTTPYHMIANRLRELARGAARHGSCGLGIGETVLDNLRYPNETIHVRDICDEVRIREMLRILRRRKQTEMAALERDLASLPDSAPVTSLLDQLNSDDELEATVEVFAYIGRRINIVEDDFLGERLARPGYTIFEGAQGILLDEDFGFHPHTTWSHTTPVNAEALLRAACFGGQVTRLGLIRAYQTRHGAGPFPTECPALTAGITDPNNPTNPWQGAFRVGWLDLPLTRYAIQAAGGVDALAISCLDQVAGLDRIRVAVDYMLNGAPYELIADGSGDLKRSERIGKELEQVTPLYRDAPAGYPFWVAEQLGVPLTILSHGPTPADKSFREK